MIFPSILPPITEDLSTYQTSCWHQEFFFFPPFLSVWTFALEVSSFFGSGPWNALMMFRFQLHWPSPKERWNSKSITNIPKSVKIQYFFLTLLLLRSFHRLWVLQLHHKVQCWKDTIWEKIFCLCFFQFGIFFSWIL